MRGGSEVRHNAHRLANALDNIEREYSATGENSNAVSVMAEILNYYEPQLLDDMHDLLIYIYELESKVSAIE